MTAPELPADAALVDGWTWRVGHRNPTAVWLDRPDRVTDVVVGQLLDEGVARQAVEGLNQYSRRDVAWARRAKLRVAHRLPLAPRAVPPAAGPLSTAELTVLHALLRRLEATLPGASAAAGDAP